MKQKIDGAKFFSRFVMMPVICLMLCAVAVWIFLSGLAPLRERYRYQHSEHFTVKADLVRSSKEKKRDDAHYDYKLTWKWQVNNEYFTYETVSGSQPSGKTRSLEIYKDKENRYHVWEPKSLMNCIVHAVMMTVLALLALGMAFVAGKYLWR